MRRDTGDKFAVIDTETNIKSEKGCENDLKAKVPVAKTRQGLCLCHNLLVKSLSGRLQPHPDESIKGSMLVSLAAFQQSAYRCLSGTFHKIEYIPPEYH